MESSQAPAEDPVVNREPPKRCLSMAFSTTSTMSTTLTSWNDSQDMDRSDFESSAGYSGSEEEFSASDYSDDVGAYDEIISLLPVAVGKSGGRSAEAARLVEQLQYEQKEQPTPQQHTPPFQPQEKLQQPMSAAGDVPTSQIIPPEAHGHYIDEQMEESCYSSEDFDSEDYSDDDEYDELMANMPIVVGRPGGMDSLMAQLQQQQQPQQRAPQHQPGPPQHHPMQPPQEQHRMQQPQPPGAHAREVSMSQRIPPDHTAGLPAAVGENMEVSCESSQDSDSASDSSVDEEYDELLASMPIAVRRPGGMGATVAHLKEKQPRQLSPQQQPGLPQKWPLQPPQEHHEMPAPRNSASEDSRRHVIPPDATPGPAASVQEPMEESYDSSRDFDSEDYSDSDDDEYEELIASMPIFSGRPGGTGASMSNLQQQQIQQQQSQQQQMRQQQTAGVVSRSHVIPPDATPRPAAVVQEPMEESFDSSQVYDSEDYSDSNDGEYDELIASMPILANRPGGMGASMSNLQEQQQHQMQQQKSQQLQTQQQQIQHVPQQRMQQQMQQLHDKSGEHSSEGDTENASEKMDEFDAEGIPLPRPDARRLSQAGSLGAHLSHHSSNNSSKQTSGGSSMSEYSSDEWSGSSDEFGDYDDLMATMPIALGRSGPAAPLPPRPMPPPMPQAVAPQASQPTGEAPMTEGLDLKMLMNFRSELEKVGQLIVNNKQGEKFLQRAHILASINMLAANVPSCVVDQLGQEIRDSIAKRKQNADPEVPVIAAGVQIGSEDSSDASELSFRSEDSSSAFAENMSLLGESHGDLKMDKKSYHVRNISDDTTATSQCSTDAEKMKKKPKLANGRLDSFLSDRSCTSKTFDSEVGDELGVLPAAAVFQGAILFVDISGFTKLSTVLDPEMLSKVINSYFQLLVHKVEEFGGDVQKFAGDALFAEWRARNDRCLEKCVAASAACASAMVQECGDFPVLSVVSSKEILSIGATTLNIHLGLGVGQMMGLHIGDSKYRREYLYIGDTIDQATEACDHAKLGEAIASQQFYDILSAIGSRQSTAATADESRLVATQNGPTFDVSSVFSERGARNANSRGVTDKIDGLEAGDLIEYRRLMSLYVHPVVVSNDVAAANNFKTSKGAGCSKERQREEAELRSVYVMFLSLKLPAQLTGDLSNDGETIHLLNDVMNLVTKKLILYCGHLRQFIVDDKGYTMIVTFGLRGSTFPKMVSERALPATLLIHQALQMELGVESKVGATFGDVYCGAVGGEKRYEYAVMGPSVNLAARLMCSTDNPGILVDKNIRQLSSQSYCFNALDPIVAKGYRDPVPIFEPLNSIEREWGRIEATFVGRFDEISTMVKLADGISTTPYPTSKFALITGESGLGKTSMLSHAIEHIRKRISCSKSHNLFIAKHRVSDSEMLINFATIRPLLVRALQHGSRCPDDATVATSATMSSFACESLSGQSHSTNLSTISESQMIDSLVKMGSELKVAASVIDSATRVLLGAAEEKAQRGKVPSKRAIASFLAHAFLRCVEDVVVAIVAIDDIHRTDEWSWLVLKRIFENADNVILAGASSVHRSAFRTPAGFVEDLDAEYKENGRFIEIELKPLDKQDLVSLCMKTLGVTRSQVSPKVLSEVMVQSGGMPQFASKILEGIKQKRLSHYSAQIADIDTDKALTEIILHRVDTFDLTVRAALNIAAVLGFSFQLGDISGALFQAADKGTTEKDVRAQAVESLKLAVKDGILLLGEEADDAQQKTVLTFDENDDGTTFMFCQPVWRTTLLGLMLQSRKRDVHHKMAKALEKAAFEKDASIDHWKKIFYHWRESGSTSHTTEAALKIGNLVKASNGDLEECARIYEQTLDTFGWVKPQDRTSCGFVDEILMWLPHADVTNLVSIMNALGKVHCDLSQHQESADMYENSLRVMQTARLGREMEDRSVAFPAYAALSHAIELGQIHQDINCRYEQAMLHSFLQETRIHGRLVHHIHALCLQMRLYTRLWQLDKAVAVYSVLKRLYKPERHSEGLRTVYGMDSGALACSLFSLIQMAQGKRREALISCRRILKELLPSIKTDFDQSFALIYPLVFVLKEGGYATEAKKVLDTVVVNRYGDGRDSRKHGYVECIFEPLSMLLTLSGVEEVSQEKLDMFTSWVCDRTTIRFPDNVNAYLGRLGRCADSIRAEICVQLAKELPEKNDIRKTVLSFGVVAASAATVNNRRNVHKMALNHAQRLQAKLRDLN